MDDDLDQKDKDLEDAPVGEGLDDLDDDLILGSKKPKKHLEDDPIESLDALADEEEGVLPEDSFDDEDLW
ncbi:MAG: hypothetical protein NTX96_01505 [Candidatus Zambryskibacteria bacterium]|nr:hypothetical protein [Candidatus Zambryskibacteria bacterium]